VPLPIANTLLTRQEITREALMVLRNNTVVIPHFYRDLDQEFGKKGGKIGATINVRKPPRAVGRDGATYTPETMADVQVPVTINKQSGVDFEFSTADKYLSLDDFRNRYLEPYMIALANKLDAYAATVAVQNTANVVGTPGSTPGIGNTNSLLLYSQAGQKIDEAGFPLKGGRTLVITPAARVGWINDNKGLYNPQGSISGQWETGQIADALGYNWFVDQNMPAQTIGALGGTPAVVGAGQTGTSLATNGWTATRTGILQIGDVISIAGVYAVNPQTRVSTGSLMNFTVQAIANSDGTGASTLTIFPAITPTGQYQNVSNSPGAGALIQVYGTAAGGQGALAGVQTRQALLWHKQAFAWVSFPGDVPNGVDMGYEDRDEDIGVSMRFLRIFDGVYDKWTNRFDVYYGVGVLYAEGACRICVS
jgi:hypothetical protein